MPDMSRLQNRRLPTDQLIMTRNRIQHNTDCVNWQYKKPVKAVTMLMLMLAQVQGFIMSLYQTLIKHFTVHQSKSNMTTVYGGELLKLKVKHNLRSQTTDEFL